MLENYSYLLLIVIVGFFIYRDYKGLNKFLYMKFRQAYREYQKTVLTNQFTYDIYIQNFIDGNHFITGESSRELNKKNLELNILFNLLKNGKDIVDKYFSKIDFSYRDYKCLKNEWAKFCQNPNLIESINTIKEDEINTIMIPEESIGNSSKSVAEVSINNAQVLSFENMLLLDDERKKQVLLGKIEKLLNTGIKGKNVAFMILALWELGYLSSVFDKNVLFDAIREKFGPKLDIGTNRGIYKYLEQSIHEQYKPEIDLLKKQFRLD